MNIDEYRAMVEQEKAEQDSTQKEQPHVQAEQTTTPDSTPEEATPNQEQTSTESQPNGENAGDATPEEQPQTIKLGEKEVSLKEIEEWERGYLRQSDYTKKTQELSAERRKLEEARSLQEKITSNPELAKQLAEEHNITSLDPQQQRVVELETKVYELELEREVSTLQQKYEDFDVREVLTYAHENKTNSLEDAYKLVKASKPETTPTQAPEPPIDVEKITADIEARIRKELETKMATTSIIGTGGNGAPPQDNTPTLSAGEQRVAQMMGLSPVDYAKWKNAK